jgi:hypothetical protein
VTAQHAVVEHAGPIAKRAVDTVVGRGRRLATQRLKSTAIGFKKALPGGGGTSLEKPDFLPVLLLRPLAHGLPRFQPGELGNLRPGLLLNRMPVRRRRVLGLGRDGALALACG